MTINQKKYDNELSKGESKSYSEVPRILNGSVTYYEFENNLREIASAKLFKLNADLSKQQPPSEISPERNDISCSSLL